MAVPTRTGEDEREFAALVDRHGRELQAHCYRMVGSVEDAQDLVQEAFLRAWRNRAGFEGRSTVRTWLYRIATNVCLDFLARHARATDGGRRAGGLEQHQGRRARERTAPVEDEPEAAIVAKENVELALLVAMRHLPPRQRAVLMLRDVLGWTARETASVLGCSVASANSALQRARETLRHCVPARSIAGAERPSPRERLALQRYADSYQRDDVTALAELLRHEVPAAGRAA